MSVRVVLDTNVLIARAYRPGSASGRLVSACLDGTLTPVVSPAILEEYRFILPRAIRGRPWEADFEVLVGSALLVEPPETPRVVEADPSDDMLFAAAAEAGAALIVSNDAQVLAVEKRGDVAVLTPSEALCSTLLGG